MNEALLVIDYTNDFVAQDGALTCGEVAQNLERYITKLTNRFITEGNYTVFACDAHQKEDHYHPETALFPPHNIVGTTGQQLYGNLQSLYDQSKQLAHVKWMNKTRYSAFCGTDLFLRLQERHIHTVHLVGVCTDICILHTAIDAYNLGLKVIIHEKGVASFNEAGHHFALSHFKNVLNATIL